MIISKEAHALRYLFLAEKTVFHVPPLVTRNNALHPVYLIEDIKIIGVVGGGLMGSGIAISLVISGFSVILYDISADMLKKAVGTFTQILQSRVRRGKLTEGQAKIIGSRLLTSTHFDE